MKKLLCFLLCSVLIFSSVSLCFATPVDWDSSDSQHLTEIRNSIVSGFIYNTLRSINSNIVLLDTHLQTIAGWLDPSSSNSTAGILNNILSMLSYTDSAQALKSWLADIWQINATNLPYLFNLARSLSNLDPGIHSFTNDYVFQNSHLSLDWTYSNGVNTGEYGVQIIQPNGLVARGTTHWAVGSPIGNLAYLLYRDIQNNSAAYAYRWGADLTGYNNLQTGLSWTDIEQSVTFTPSSSTNGIYNWLKNIQIPVARLSYVLASDERIAAQEAAAANEEAVVDNFIDSSGDGSASPSDIGSVSDLSSGYKQNFGSDASVSGIFDIFNSDHATWFSQETKNQLDTTTPTRLTKGSESETPLLNKQIEDIYNALGVKQP